jgi:hypothetical protein
VAQEIKDKTARERYSDERERTGTFLRECRKTWLTKKSVYRNTKSQL